jgi:hypothetical protein
MKNVPGHGVLILSVDGADQQMPFANEPMGTSIAREKVHDNALFGASKWLLELLDQQGLQATWFFEAPATSPMLCRIVRSRLKHEIGLSMCDSGSSKLSRAALARNLQRGLLAARSVDVEITSVSIAGSTPTEQLDLLAKYGIRSIRPGIAATDPQCDRRSGWNAVSVLRFGILNLPHTATLTNASRMPRWITNWTAARSVTAAAKRQQYCHLAINLCQLVEARQRSQLEWLLRHAARIWKHNNCRIETMSSVSAALVSRPSAPHTQSILRAA